MEKGCPPHESAPPYPGPLTSEGGVMPPPMMHPQPSISPGPPPHPEYPGGSYSGGCPQPGLFPGAAPPAGHPGEPYAGMYTQTAFSPGPPPAEYPGGVPSASVIHAAPGTVVTQILVPPTLRDTAGRVTCQHCQQTVLTNMEYTNGMMTWLMCCVLGGFLCCWIPFRINACKDVEHRCPSCGNLIYIYRRNENYGHPVQGRYVGRAYL